jgi:predicted deacylase
MDYYLELADMVMKGFANDPERKLPSILITAGVHGNETGAMLLLNQLMADFETAEPALKINATFINYANPTGIENVQRKIYGQDMSDLNRGWADGDCRRTLGEYVRSHDVLLDLHCSPQTSEFLLFNNGQNVNYQWLEEQKIPFVIRDGSFDTLKMFADREGQLGMTWEMKGMDFPDAQAIQKSREIIMQRILGDWSQFSKKAYDDSSVAKNLMPEQLMQGVFPRFSGLVDWIGLEGIMGRKVKAGDELGRLISLQDGNIMEKLLSPCDGTVVCMGNAFVKAYNPACYIQPKIGQSS